MVLENRIALLKQQIANRDKLNNMISSQIIGDQIVTENIDKFQKPIVDKLKETNTKLDANSYPKFLEHTETNEIKPYFIQDKSINENTLKSAKTVRPTFSTKYIKNNDFQVIKINSKDHILYQDNNKIFIFNHDIAPEKYQTFEFTDDLSKLIRGFVSDVDDKYAFETYLKIFQNANCSTNTNYYKSITRKLKTLNDPIIEGEGIIKYITSNPIELFMKLCKLFAAKKAGHNNVNSEIQHILDRLKKKIISKNNYDKWKVKSQN